MDPDLQVASASAAKQLRLMVTRSKNPPLFFPLAYAPDPHCQCIYTCNLLVIVHVLLFVMYYCFSGNFSF